MGTTKLMCERLITAANAQRRGEQPILASSRFGNVLGSSGSVIPVFARQIAAGGPVRLTDPDMTRFIMTLSQAVQLVLDLGLDIDAVDDKGETAMHGAAYKHLPRVVALLAEAGADIAVWNQKNDRGASPLDIAIGMHRGMNILSSVETADAIRDAMRKAGVDPDAAP
mgnify:CR=1 FL=1